MSDVIGRAMEAARSSYPDGMWEWFASRDRTQAIYREMRRIDAEDAAGAAHSSIAGKAIDGQGKARMPTPA